MFRSDTSSSFHLKRLVDVAVQTAAERIEGPYPRQLQLHSAERENSLLRSISGRPFGLRAPIPAIELKSSKARRDKLKKEE